MERLFEEQLATLQTEGCLRRLPTGGGAGVDFTSNDYLGLSSDVYLRQFHASVPEARTARLTSVASRLLASDQEHYMALERRLGELWGREALLLNSGYHANTGIIPALAVKGTVVVADRLVHASIIDGVRLSGAPMRRFRHNDPADLRRCLEAVDREGGRALIVVESVYSMDGDTAPLREIAALKQAFGDERSLLYVDEAHAVGVCGPQGLGLARDIPGTDIIIGTLGKALASSGAFAICSPVVRQWLVNKCRSLIFSTALPPLQALWSLWTLERSLPMDDERARLRRHGERVNAALRRAGAVSVASDSHIQPWMVGDAVRAMQLSSQLEAQGLHVMAIRRPTVPPGTERLRISLSAAHTDDQIDRLVAAIHASAR